jgi:competence protein ComEC
MFVISLLSPWLAVLPSIATALLLHLMRFSVDHVAQASLADLRTPAPVAFATSLAVLAVVIACITLRSQHRPYLATGVVVLLCIPVTVLYPTPPLLHAGKLEVTALDVGQGDSLLVVSPAGQTMLIDAGGPVGRSEIASTTSFDIGEEVVAPYLWSRRIRRLDVVMLTHAHSDHMGGMPAVLRDFQPHELWLSIEPANSPGLQALLAQARAQHIIIRHLHAGNAFNWSDLHANILSPELPYTNAGTAINDDSLVLRLDYDRASVLLEGDAEASSEATMLALHRIAPATLLKVGHHGSKTSTNPDFLSAVAPEDAVISVGRHNTFGHPRFEVLGRLEAAHIQTYRTDRAGTETFLLTPDGRISADAAALKSP